MNYADFILNTLSATSKISDTERCIDYKRLHYEVYNLRLSLMEIGVNPTDIVGVMLDNRIGFLTSVLAINLLGAKTMPIYVGTGDQKLQRIISTYRVRYLLCPKKSLAGVMDCVIETEHLGNGIYAHCLLPEAPPYRNDTFDEALYMLTSGTTQEPKCVILTNRNIISSISNISNYLNLCEHDKMMVVKNVVHISTLVGEILVGVYCGCSIHFSNRLLVGSYLERELCARNISALFLTPSILRNILPMLRESLKTIRFIHVSGEMLNYSLVQQFHKIAPYIELYAGYGLTEAAPRITQISIHEMLSHPGSVGKPIGDQSIRIINLLGQYCSNNEQGEILVKGSNIMKGYLIDDTVVSPPQGWLHTGDLGYIDADGYLYVNGRKDNMFIIFGRNIYPEEIERVIATYPGIRNVLVCKSLIGKEYRIIAKIEGNNIDLAALHSFCKMHLEDYKVPTKFELHESLPMTITGKISRLN